MRFLYTILALFSALVAHAQVDLEAFVSGFPNRTPLASIQVQLKNPSTGFTAVEVTDDFGKVRFKGLSLSGSYELTIDESNDYEGIVQKGIVLISNTNTEIQLVLIQKNVTLPEIRINGSKKKLNCCPWKAGMSPDYSTAFPM